MNWAQLAVGDGTRGRPRTGTDPVHALEKCNSLDQMITEPTQLDGAGSPRAHNAGRLV
jgi:hypothetical protein